jgi:3-dehydroshikimate dehydratase
MCSITMRQMGTDEVIALAVRAKLAGIEWGADGHVPPGETALAESVARRCGDAGVAVTSYGTYLGMAPFDDPDSPPDELAAALDSAEALGAPLVRAWTAFGTESNALEADRAKVIATTVAITEAAATRGLGVALEFHPGTLTHTAGGALAVLSAVNRPTLRTHWQPAPTLGAAEAVAELEAVADSLAYLHVFAWGPGGMAERHPLAAGAELWRPALAVAAEALPIPGDLPRYCLLEYVADDDPEQLVTDAATLNAWIAAL